MQTSYELNQSSPALPIHLSDLLAVFKRRKWIIIWSIIFPLGAVSLISFTAHPVYQASSQIIIEAPSSPMSNTGTSNSGRNSGAQQFLQTQYHLLQSRELVQRVVEQLGLREDYHKPSARSNRPPSLASRLFSWFLSNSQATEAVEQKVAPVAPPDDFIIDNYLNHLVITPVGNSQLVDIKFLSASPARAAQIANAHARAFIELNTEKNHAKARQRLNWLEGEIKRQKNKVETSLNALHSYQRQNNIISLDERQNMISQRITELNSALIQAGSDVETNRTAFEELRRRTANGAPVLSLPEISRDEIVHSLRNDLLQLNISKSEAATTFGPDHPKMIEIDNRIRQVKKELAHELVQLRGELQSNYGRSITMETKLRRQLEKAQAETLALREKQSAYDVLQLEAESNRKLYDLLLTQAKEIGLLSVFDSNNVRLIEQARIPFAPSSPNIPLNILMACLLGVFTGAGLSLFVEYVDNTIKTAEDVQRRLGMHVLGGIPYEKSLRRSRFPALPEPTPKAGNNKKLLSCYSCYDDVAVRLPTKFRFYNTGQPGQVLLVESAAIGEGKTTVLGNIAVSLGKGGFRVLVVDCDFQRPAAHHLFEVKNNGGLVGAMNRILSQNISNGTLDACGMGDLFALIALRKHSGRLTVTNQSRNMSKRIFFQDGRLLHIESSKTPVKNRLGTMLLRSGFISKAQLANALEWNQRTGMPLGQVLLNAGYIKQNQLKGLLKLQMREHLHTLFSWKQGRFSFKRGKVETYAHDRICFAEDYGPLTKQLGRMAGRPMFEREILARITPTKRSNVQILPTGAAADLGMINYRLLIDCLDLLKQRFDVILIDTPPLLNSASAAPLHSLADGVVFVIKTGKVSIRMLNEAKTRLAEYDSKVIGVILNQVKNIENSLC